MEKMSIIKAASIILERSNGDVLICHRSPDLRAFADLWAFTGGKIDQQLSDTWVGDELEVKETIMREMYEEIGILPGIRSTFSPNNRNRNWLSHDYDDELRDQFLDNLRFIGRKLTPPFLTTCFDAAYYILSHPMVDEFNPIVDGGELVECRWMQPSDIISAWELGKMFLPPPTLHVLRTMIVDKDNLDLKTLVETELPIGLQTKVEFAPGIVAIPMFSKTIDPFISTNMVIIKSEEESLLVDPGAIDFDHLDQIVDSIAPLKYIVLTHHHSDHHHAVSHIVKNYPGIKVLAHKETISRLEYEIEELGETIFLGSREIKVINTPGHTSGHISLYDPQTSVLMAGDHIVGMGSAVLDPESGNMKQYVDTTKELQDLDIRLIIPAHGPVIYHPKQKLQEYLDHRQHREDAILEAIKNGANTLVEIVKVVYTDVPESMWIYATKNIRLHIDKLLDEGRLKSF